MSGSREELVNNLDIEYININIIEENFNKLMDVKPPQKINKIIIKAASGLLKTIKTNEIKMLERIAIEISMLERKLNIKGIWNTLVQFEINELEVKVNDEIKISQKQENRRRKNIKNIEKLKSELKFTLRDIKTKRRKHMWEDLYFRNSFDDRYIHWRTRVIKYDSKWIKNSITSTKKINDKPRRELIDRLVRFNEFANKLNIKLIKGPKNCILNTLNT